MCRLVAVLTAAVLTGVGLAAGGCSGARSGALGPAPSAPAPAGSASTLPAGAGTPSGPAPPATPGSAGRPSGAPAPAGSVTIQLWFVRAGTIAPTARTRPATLTTSRLALTELAAGPSAAEAATGLATGVPTGADITGIAGGVETVSFPAAFYAGDAAAVRLRQAQVVYTLTQFPAVSKVAFRSAGAVVGVPAGRDDYADLLPAIVVLSPVIGELVANPATVAGTADVFEGTVSVRVLDAAGREIATAFTSATCGTGCRGDYRVAVGYAVTAEQRGTIEVYEVSARDGSRLHVVAVPVTLTVR
jgi:immunoglobulin-like protein involved in spore germination/sporulation and spore germination protein